MILEKKSGKLFSVNKSNSYETLHMKEVKEGKKSHGILLIFSKTNYFWGTRVNYDS